MRLSFFYPPIFSSSRLSFPISHEFIRKISSMKRITQNSSPRNNPATSRNHISRLPAGESGQSVQQPESLEMSGVVKEKNRPLGFGGASFRYKIKRRIFNQKISKRRTKIDLGGSISEPIMDRGVGINSRKAAPLVLNSESKQEDDFSLPTSFGKKKKCAPFASQVVTKDSSLVEPSNTEKPFDICVPGNRKLARLKPPGNRKLARLKPPRDDNDGGEQLARNHSIEENGLVLRPGMVLLKNYLKLHEQVDIVTKCRELGLGHGGFYQPRFKNGAKLRLHMMCLGKDWDPQTKRYGEIRQHDGSKPPDIPPCFISLVEKALQHSYSLIKRDLETSNVEDILPGISPDLCIINFYIMNGRLGLHQDRDESEESLLKGLPVVSVSIGDSAEFLYGDERDVEKAERVKLESGDVLIFGGKSRHIYHGVSSIMENTAPRHLITSTKLRPGRLNLTFRQF